jgi:hypothetical protein
LKEATGLWALKPQRKRGRLTGDCQTINKLILFFHCVVMSKRPRKDRAKGPPPKRVRRSAQELGEEEAKLPAPAQALLKETKHARYRGQILAYFKDLGGAGFEVRPKEVATAQKESPEDPNEWVRLKYVISNPWGPDFKEDEEVPRNALDFLDMVHPEISVTVAKHAQVEVEWLTLDWSANKKAEGTYDSAHWLKALPNYSYGRWAAAVIDADFGEAAYDYYYIHLNDDDGEFWENVLSIWHTGALPKFDE